MSSTRSTPTSTPLGYGHAGGSVPRCRHSLSRFPERWPVNGDGRRLSVALLLNVVASRACRSPHSILHFMFGAASCQGSSLSRGSQAALPSRACGCSSRNRDQRLLDASLRDRARPAVERVPVLHDPSALHLVAQSPHEVVVPAAVRPLGKLPDDLNMLVFEVMEVVIVGECRGGICRCRRWEE